MFSPGLALTRVLAAVPPRLRVVGPNEGDGPLPPSSGEGPGPFRRGLAALHHRNYRYYWLGQIVSLVGTWMQSVSQPWLVLLLGGSPLQLGLVLALEFTPPMFLAPLGGVLADRVDKRQALMVTSVVKAVQAVILFALTITGVVQIWHVMLLATMLGFASAVEMPVRQAFAAELVPRRDLVNAIALNSASFNLARVVGPAVAGIALAFFGPAFNFGINAVSYVAVLIGLWWIDPEALHRVERPERFDTVRRSLAEGLRYAIHTPSVLWPLALLLGVATFGMNFQTLLPLFARNTLGMGAEGYGTLYATMGVGSLIGSLGLAFASRRPMLGLMLGGGAAFVVFELLLGLTRDPRFAYPLILLIGLSSMLMINTINVMVQNSVSHELRGRVMSLYVTVFAGSAPIGGFLAGAVAEVWQAPAGFVLGALLSALAIGLVAWQLLFRDKDWADASASARALPDEERRRAASR
ncbi:MAG TPA: MFS transporter [Candidatus Limnocylindria bacterium]|nr:MFS transporter [Candidatus Limnocylindria bacterium]